MTGLPAVFETSAAASANASNDLDLRAFFAVLRRRWWIVVLVPLLATAAGYAAARSQTPKYSSTSSILLQQSQTASLLDPLAASSDPTRVLGDQIRIIGGRQVSSLAAKRLGYPATVTATPSSSVDVIVLSAESSNPQQAAAIVNAYDNAYLAYLASYSASQNAAAQQVVQTQINNTQQQVNQLASLSPAQAAAHSADLAALNGRLATEQAQLSELQASANVDQSDAQILSPASVPTTPFSPRPLRTAAISLAVGIMLAFGLVLLVDYLDNRIRGKDDLERCTRGLPIMGLIPRVPGWRNAQVSRVVTMEDPTSASAEAYRGLRASIQFLAVDRSLRTIQVTSPSSSEGKSTTLVNLAVTLARAGQRVTVVDCDLRRPRVDQFFNLNSDIGFTTVLLGQTPLSTALQNVPNEPGLRVLPAGDIPPNPSELLAGRRTKEILESVLADADFVLVDSPPVLPVSDAAVIATLVDATILVVNDNATRRKQLSRTLELLGQVDAGVIGTVLNRTEEGASNYKYRGRYYQYAPRSSNGSRAADVAAASNGNGKKGRSNGDRRVKKPVAAKSSAEAADSR
ncbi:MAG TPA: polysaccharide biosynthesis tyrosine autokinase [Acidimicrobiales bacterium]|nr:polysaccharide biosynthesis tyrosine autokinase [Acidimicrobiales bacterium]